MLLVIIIVAMLYPPIRLSALVLAGRSPACPMGQAVKADSWKQRKTETKDRILAGSKALVRDGALEQWQTPHGVFWTPYESRYGLAFHLAEQQMGIYGTGEFAVRKGDIVLDCGANIGTFTRTALDRGAKTVVAIEPAPENLECLRRNFAKEIAEKRVIIYPKGVWHEDATLTLHLHHDNSAADSFIIKDDKTPHGHTVTAPLTTVDKMVAELGLPRVDFIKMDIEGAETNALRGAQGTLSKHHPRLAMSVYHEPSHPVEVPRLIREAWSGYRATCGPCAVVENRIRPDILYSE